MGLGLSRSSPRVLRTPYGGGCHSVSGTSQVSWEPSSQINGAAAYSVGYIAGWSNADTAIIKATASRVLAAAHHIAEILDPTNDTDQEPTIGS